MEPSNAEVEAGCQGTLRVEVRATGERAHSARSWKGVNAIHRASADPRAAHGLRAAQAGHRRAGVPRGAQRGLHPRRRRRQRAARRVRGRGQLPLRPRPQRGRGRRQFVRDFFEGYDVTVTDSAPGALPGLDLPAAKAFIEAVGREVNPKFGWTDVARFTGLGIPAVNFGPGDPMLAHKQEEHVPVEHIERCERQLREWLSVVVRSKHKGPVIQRRDQVDGSTTDQRLLDSRGPTRLGAHRPVAGAADPGRVRRGLRRAGRARPGDRRLRLGPHAARPPDVRPGRAARAARWSRPASR